MARELESGASASVDDWKLPWEGGCMCSGVRFRITLPPLLTMACHCTGCQRLSASAYSLSIAVPTEGLAVLKGETVRGAMHGPNRHLYCPHCKNWLFTHPHGMDFFVNIRATMLDDHGWYAPFAETYTDEKLPWAATGAPYSFGAQPGMDAWTPILEAFKREGARPK